MDPQVSNGSVLPNEHITNILVFSFFKNCSNCNFRVELEVLGDELPVPAYLKEECDDELQTDGNRSSHLRLGRPEIRLEADSGSQEEVIQIIAEHLAQIGDEIESKVHPSLVQNLAMQFMNMNLSEAERRECLGTALEQAMQTCLMDMELEKKKLMLILLLAKKVANHKPCLLRDVFRTTVNFINQNLLTYVRNLARNIPTGSIFTRWV
ncbi:BH3-interacting domain death agonist isoform 1-T1 [Dugong dugon]